SSVTVYALSPVEGQPMSSVNVGTISGGTCQPVSSYIGFIDWGDGTTNQATFGGGCPSILVQGSHTYTDELTNINISVRVTQPSTAFGQGATFSVAEGDVLLASGAGALTATEGTALSGVQLGTFTNTGYPLNPATDFTASIDWGDGTALDTSGTVTG